MSAAYFALPAVNNSDLLALRRAFGGLGELEGLDEIFNFGNLVDAMLTEPHRVDHVRGALLEDGVWIDFMPKDFLLAKAMHEKAKSDPVVQLFIKHGKHQHIVTRTIGFEYEGMTFEIEGKCKFDSLFEPSGMDYKTTSCTTRKACEASIDHFNYDQGSAWYMDLAGIDRHWLCFISKKTKEVFKFAVERDGEIYSRGKKKYSFWAYMWILLVGKFDVL